MDSQKIQFLFQNSFELLNRLENSSPPKWGVMNAQQMIEHLADFYNVSAEKISCKLYTSEEHLPAYKAFLLSDKAFRENTKAPVELLGDEPRPLRFATLAEAKDNLKKSVSDFAEYFNKDKERKTLHPVFGFLNFDEWVLLHYKHVQHHLKQFDLINAV